MADHKLDAERLGLDRDPLRPSVRDENAELTPNVKMAAFWLTLIAVVVGLWVYVRAKSGPPHSSPDSAALELKAERSDGRLLLMWNSRADVVLDAQRATLTIIDGDRTDNVPLDPGQLRAGSIVYSPRGGDVSFRLEVISGGGESRSESVRVFLSGKP
jgi:hypothetical protein